MAYGRRAPTNHGDGTSHMLAQIKASTFLIKAGVKIESKKGGMVPTRLPGFLICRKAAVNKGEEKGLPTIYPPAYDLMEKLGFPREDVDRAIARGANAPEGLLPRSLTIQFLRNAVRATGQGWIYEGTYAARNACYRKGYLFCSGDGEQATRKVLEPAREGVKDPKPIPGYTRTIPCRPLGTPGCEPSELCPESVSGDCGPEGAMQFDVLIPDTRPNDQRPPWMRFRRLDSTIGSTFSIGTGSGNALDGLIEQLDAAADQLEGRIAGLIARLDLLGEASLTGEGRAVVGRARLQFIPEQIRWLQRKLNQLALEDARRNHQIRLLGSDPPGESEPGITNADDGPTDPDVVNTTLWFEPSDSPPEAPRKPAPAYEPERRPSQREVDPDPAPEAAEDEEIVTRILRTNSKPGKREGTFIYGVQVDGERWLNTFSETAYKAAVAAQQSGQPVRVVITTNGRYTNIKAIYPVTTQPTPAPPQREILPEVAAMSEQELCSRLEVEVENRAEDDNSDEAAVLARLCHPSIKAVADLWQFAESNPGRHEKALQMARETLSILIKDARAGGDES